MSDAVADRKTTPADPAWRIAVWLGSGVLLVLLILLGARQDAKGALWSVQALGMIAGGGWQKTSSSRAGPSPVQRGPSSSGFYKGDGFGAMFGLLNGRSIDSRSARSARERSF